VSGIDLIAAERQRQIDAEGWTVEHDDEHSRNELAWAAASYAIPPARGPLYEGEHPTYIYADTGLPITWPWDAEWWNPSPEDRVRELVKAGALVAAEIDRLQRLAGRGVREP